MNGRYILDTNIVIALFANDEVVLNSIKQSKEIIIPSIVIGELYYGAFNSKQIQENINKIQYFSESVFIAQCDSITAKLYGKIKTELR